MTDWFHNPDFLRIYHSADKEWPGFEVPGMFEAEELNEELIIYCDEAHFWINGYVNKQKYRFWGTQNPNISLAKSFHPRKVTAWAAISVKGIYLQFLESTVTAESCKQLLETKFFPYAKKRGLVKNFYFMQDGATLYWTHEVFEAIHRVYGNRVISLGYPKFAQGRLEWPPYSPDLDPCDFFLWDNENASLPLLISEVYRLIPYIGSEYVHFHPKNMPDVKIDKIEIIGIVTDKIELQKYISYTVDDSTGTVPVLCPKKPVNEDESTDSQESSDDESFAHKEKKLELKPPFGLAPSAPYSYQTHIQSLWFQARGKEFCYDEVLLYDYVHVIGFCAMDIRHQKNVSKLTNDDIELGRLFMFGMNLRKISEADHNAMTKSLITRVARQRYVKPKVE
ncbi:uncharacterized protein LOC124180565 isoform X1 [Neodiprion fabricii]|uniref:uncharacterized protein LOC124180565 isoform X1 n=1 Tax=Neodiprion fabricii TaxID=2872261 RepID=UPI001ED93EB5|nr:uncharacterized protein LOC124180565 isoform X1 [Neodiprion fabricii]